MTDRIRKFSRIDRIARRAPRSALILSLAVVLAIGSLAVGPAKASAAVPEARTAVPTGVVPDFMFEPPLVTGSSMVLGTYVTTNAGQSWAQHLDLVGSLRYVGNGVQVDLASDDGWTTCQAQVFTLATFAKATYPVPSCDIRDMNDTLAVTWSGTAFSVLNYVQGGTPQTLSAPAGGSSFSKTYVMLTSAGGILWIGQGATSWSFAFATSTTSAPGPWTAVPGILGFPALGRTFTLTATNLLYAGGVPASGISGVVLNVTAVASAAGFLTVYPADVGAPNASNVNFTAGQVVPNLVAVKTSASGAVAIRNSSLGSTNVIADLAGYVTA